MVANRFTWRAAGGLLMAVGSGCACAQEAPPFGAPVTVYAGTREYVWTLSLPVLTTERVPVVIPVLALHLRGQRWDYEAPTLKSQRFKLGQVAEFNCKYSDLGLPQTCLTTWRDVYADLPVLAMQRDHLDYDAAQWVWEDKTLHIDVPRWKWQVGTLTVSLPTFGPKDVAHAQTTVDAQQAAAAQVLDQAIATLDTSIATVEAQGADPHRLSTGQATIDLPALRQALLDEKAHELEQLGAIRGELRELAATASDAAVAPTTAP